MVCYRELFENVRTIVSNYYGWDIENDIFTNESFRYTLQHSTFYSSGNSNQNCYGYALGQYSNITPGYYAYGYNLSGSQLQSLSSLDLANRVKADLESSTFNQQCVFITLALKEFYPLVSGCMRFRKRIGKKNRGSNPPVFSKY